MLSRPRRSISPFTVPAIGLSNSTTLESSIIGFLCSSIVCPASTRDGAAVPSHAEQCRLKISLRRSSRVCRSYSRRSWKPSLAWLTASAGKFVLCQDFPNPAAANRHLDFDEIPGPIDVRRIVACFLVLVAKDRSDFWLRGG